MSASFFVKRFCCRKSFPYVFRSQKSNHNVCVFVFVLCTLLLANRGDKARALSSECKFGRADFTVFNLPPPCSLESCSKIKINLNFYFHTSLWCLKRFCEGLKGLHKTF